VCTSGRALIGETFGSRRLTPQVKQNRSRSTELYHQGFSHYIAAHGLQLLHVTVDVSVIVEEGKLEVDIEGVLVG
jgi:hypothetical protein